MKKSLVWYLWYLLFFAVFTVGFVIWFRDFVPAAMMVSFTVSDPLYLKLDKAHQRKWLVPCGIALALALGVFYYVADFIVFPHSARAASRLQDACWIGSLWASAGLSVAHWSPNNKRPSRPAKS